MANAEKKALKEQRKAEKKAMKAHLKAQRTSFWSDFKTFITKGNVLDLAVAVVIGAAFGEITKGLVNYIINPVVSLLTGGISLEEWKTALPGAEIDEVTGEILTPELFIYWGSWIQTIINFLIIALSIFIFVRVIKKMNDKLRYKELAAQKAAAEQKKAEDDAKAAAAAAVAAEKEAQLEAFYKNIEKQTELLEKLANK